MEPVPYRFILDVHLGKLARYLRLCGFDTTFSASLDDKEIIELSRLGNRIILTRDKLLLENKKVTRGLLIRSQWPEEQLKELFSRFDIKGSVAPFTRCMECNSLLLVVDKEKIADRLQPRTREFYNEFRICPSCDHIYWEGSHFNKMKMFVNNIIENMG